MRRGEEIKAEATAKVEPVNRSTKYFIFGSRSTWLASDFDGLFLNSEKIDSGSGSRFLSRFVAVARE